MAGPSLSMPEGTLLGDRYSLSERIGLGGMASVWLAEDVRLGREVAVKILSEALAEDEAFVARFRREARVAAALTHPNLVSIFDFDPDGEQPYLVMEYIPGPNLAQRIERGDLIQGERVAADLLSALAAIHGAGVVHRDVKPANVLIAPGGRAMLTDFGIARPEDSTAITQTGQMPGTQPYMAPELLEGEPASPRTDLYSCGVLLKGILSRESSPAHCELADRLADPDPRRRPPSAQAALAELPRTPAARLAKRSFDPDPPTQERPADTSRPRPLASPSSTGSRSRLIAGAAVAAVLLAVGLAIALSGGGNDPLRAGELGQGGGQTQASGNGEEGGGGNEGSAAEAAPAESEKAPTAGLPEPAARPDPAEAASLNEEGFALIQEGRADEAVPLLERAVSLYGEDTDDINYAYALFNLGQALVDSGQPEAAIPVLRARLEIPDQTDVVQQELDAARAQAG